jgi:hypothetical protein
VWWDAKAKTRGANRVAKLPAPNENGAPSTGAPSITNVQERFSGSKVVPRSQRHVAEIDQLHCRQNRPPSNWRPFRTWR